MTALAANRFIKEKGQGPKDIAVAVADSVHIYKGSLVALHSGYAIPAADTSGDVIVGIAIDEADNTVAGHTAGGITVRVRSGITWVGAPCTGMAQSNVGAEVYVLDSALVALTGGVTNHVHVGVIVFFNSSTSVDVFIPAAGVGA